MVRVWGEHDERTWLVDVVRDLGVPAEHFRILGIREWQWIERKATDTFIRRPFAERTGLWFADLSPPFVVVPQGWTEADMAGLCDSGERVFAGFGDDFGKFWWCDGRYAEIVGILWEMPNVDLKIVPPTFEWLLYQDHHDNLFAKNEPVQSRAAALPNAKSCEAT